MSERTHRVWPVTHMCVSSVCFSEEQVLPLTNTHMHSYHPVEQVWYGQVCIPELSAISAHCRHVAGMGDLAALLGNQPIDVKGTVSANPNHHLRGGSRICPDKSDPDLGSHR